MTQPGYQTTPVATGNPITMVLGLIAGTVIIGGGLFLDWLSGSSSKAAESGFEIFWSVTPASDPSFFSSAAFVVLIIGAITSLGAALARGGVVVFGGMLAVLAFVLVMVSFYRVQVADLGIGDAGPGLWAILVGGGLAIVAGSMARRTLG
jgi:hypothetical protein